MTCQGCGAELPPPKKYGRPRVWCSEHCRKRSCYTGVCSECGKTTYSGSVSPPTICSDCFNKGAHEGRHWTPATIIAALQRFAAETGESPSATRWLHGDRPDYAPTVTSVQREFGSWSAAIKAAGLAPRPLGRPRKLAA